MRSPPTAGSFSIAVFTRVVMVVSSIVSPTVLPHAAVSGSSNARASSHRVPKFNRFMPASTSVRARQYRLLRCAGVRGSGCNLHARDVEARVDHDYFAGDAARGVAEEERRTFGHFGGIDVTPERRPIAIDRQDVGKARDARGGECLDRPC